MPDTKITALTALTAADPANDVLPIVDVSDTTMAASGTTKKISINNVLGASGTATLASATITGALTAQGTQVKLSNQAAADCTVLIGPDTPSSTRSGRIGFITSSTEKNWFIANNWNVPGGFEITQSTAAGGSTMSSNPTFRINNNSDFLFLDGAGGTRMTLNSTGLGVGGSPTAKLSVVATGKGFVFGSTSATGAYAAWQYNSADVGYVGNGTSIVAGAAATDFGLTSSAGGKLWLGSNNGASYAVLDASGNVGIGVTPSAWQNTVKALQVGTQSSVWQYSSQTFITNNRYFDGANKFIGNGYSLTYNQNPSTGEHVWFNTTNNSSGAGAALSPIQAMTLESTGSLVLGAAAVATTATDGFLYIPGCAGTPTGTPTAKTGRVPLVVDTTNNKLYFYSGGAWVAAN